VTNDLGETSNVVAINPKTMRLLNEQPLQSALSKYAAHYQCHFKANSIWLKLIIALILEY